MRNTVLLKKNCQMQWMIEYYGETVLWNAEQARRDDDDDDDNISQIS